MKITSQFKTYEESKYDKKKFPKIMMHDNGDLIVMFTDYEEGIVLLTDGSWEVGDSDQFDLEDFDLFRGEITIKVED